MFIVYLSMLMFLFVIILAACHSNFEDLYTT
jgi:hypothetical protein